MERQAPATALMWACPMASKSALCPETGPFWLPCALPRYFATGPCRTYNPQSGETASSCAVCLYSFPPFLFKFLVYNACFYNVSYTMIAVEAERTHSQTHAYTHACMLTLKHVRTHSCMHAHTHAHSHAHTHAHAHGHTHKCTHPLMHALTHSHAHTLTHLCTDSRMHAHTHACTHTCTQKQTACRHLP